MVQTIQTCPGVATINVVGTMNVTGAVIPSVPAVTLTNLGTGSGLVVSPGTSPTIQIRALAAGSGGINITQQGGGQLQIDNTLVGSNLGSGQAIYSSKTSAVEPSVSSLNFKTLTNTDGMISLSNNSNNVIINANQVYGTSLSSATAAISAANGNGGNNVSPILFTQTTGTSGIFSGSASINLPQVGLYLVTYEFTMDVPANWGSASWIEANLLLNPSVPQAAGYTTLFNLPSSYPAGRTITFTADFVVPAPSANTVYRLFLNNNATSSFNILASNMWVERLTSTV